jgi:hypothetical protein
LLRVFWLVLLFVLFSVYLGFFDVMVSVTVGLIVQLNARLAEDA